jgi:hypothetical protein
VRARACGVRVRACVCACLGVVGQRQGVRTHHRHALLATTHTLQAGGFARRCSSSGRVVYPRIDPAIITLVMHGDWCLLGRKQGWPAGRWGAAVVPSHTNAQAHAHAHLHMCTRAHSRVSHQHAHTTSTSMLYTLPTLAPTHTHTHNHAGTPRLLGFLSSVRRWSRRCAGRCWRRQAWRWTWTACGE